MCTGEGTLGWRRSHNNAWHGLASTRPSSGMYLSPADHAEPDTIGAHVDHVARGWVAHPNDMVQARMPRKGSYPCRDTQRTRDSWYWLQPRMRCMTKMSTMTCGGQIVLMVRSDDVTRCDEEPHHRIGHSHPDAL